MMIILQSAQENSRVAICGTPECRKEEYWHKKLHLHFCAISSTILISLHSHVKKMQTINHKTGNTGAMQMQNIHIHSFSSPMLSSTAISGKYDEPQTIKQKTEKRCTVNSKETERKRSVHIH